MDDASDRVLNEFESFAKRWFAPTLVIFLRSVRDAALAYDLTTDRAARPTRVAAHRQRRRVHRHTTQGQGAPTNRTRAPPDRQQELAAIPPPNLRKDRAPTPNTQALPRPPEAL